MSEIKAWGIAGLSAVCKTVRAGFDSLPRLQYSPKKQAVYAMRDGKRIGPFLYSNDWIRIEEQAKLIFGEDEGAAIRKELERAAHNSAYKAPAEHIHLAREAISYYRHERDRFKEDTIKARKEISKLKRTKEGCNE